MSLERRNVLTRASTQLTDGGAPQATGGGASQATGGGVRNMDIDQATLKELDLQCFICKQMLDCPKVLSCGHSFCLDCLKKYHSTTRYGVIIKKINCPTCGKTINLNERKIYNLPNDFRAEQMINLMKATVYLTKNTCEVHNGQDLIFYCRKCSVPTCRDCPIVDHRSQDGHDLVNLKQVLDEEFKTYEQVKQATDQIHINLGARSIYLMHELNSLDVLEEKVNKTIDKKFEDLIIILKMRKIKMKEKAHEIVTDQKNRVKLREMRVKAAMTAMKEHSKNFTQSRQSNNVHTILAMNEKMRGVNTFMTETGTSTDDSNLLQSCEFKTDDEHLLNILKNVGDIEVNGFTDNKDIILAEALFDYKGEAPDELSFCTGDVLTVIEQDNGGFASWWFCSLGGQQGLVPGTFLKIISGMENCTVGTLKMDHLNKDYILAEALFDYEAEAPDELSFCSGDLLIVIEQDTGGFAGWWFCSHERKQGIVPGNHLKIISGMGSCTNKTLKMDTLNKAEAAQQSTSSKDNE